MSADEDDTRRALEALAEVRAFIESEPRRVTDRLEALNAREEDLDAQRSAMNETFRQFARQVQSLIDAQTHRRDVLGLLGKTPEQLGEAILALIPGDGDW